MRSLWLQPDDLLKHPVDGVVDRLRHLVSPMHAMLAIGLWLLPWWVYPPLNTSAFIWAYRSAPFSRACGRKQPKSTRVEEPTF